MKLITIIGTALAICLITIVLATTQIQLVNTSTEPYRSRTLYVPYMNVKEKSGSINGSIAPLAIRKIFLQMKNPEAVAAYTLMENVTMSGRHKGNFDMKICNNDYFKLYKLHFMAGHPCSENPDRREVVLSESTSHALFSTCKGIIGQHISINRIPYIICGIVQDVTPTNKQAATDAWIGYDFKQGSTVFDMEDESNGLYNFFFKADLLLRRNEDEKTVRKEMTELTARFQKQFPDRKISFNGEPERRESFIYHYASNIVPDMDDQYRKNFLIYLILLIVPSLNLMNIALSSFSRMENDIRIMRVFGATHNMILWKLIRQSFWTTLTGGCIGLGMTILLCKCFPFLLFNSPRVDLADVLHLPFILYALLFCLLLNLFSNLLPAWRISRKTICPEN